MYPMGYAEVIPFFGIPPRAHTVLYSIVLSVDAKDVRGREIRTLYSTHPATTLTLKFPPSVDRSSGLNLYIMHPVNRPNTAKWNGPYRAAISGSDAAFTLPALQFSTNHTAFIFAITQ